LFQRREHCAGALAMMANWDLEPLKRALPKLGLPVLILHGARDAAIPVAAAREAAGLIPGAVVEVSESAGHLLHEEMPEQVVERMTKFAAIV
jgi:magnesium chelatase accessory protein